MQYVAIGLPTFTCYISNNYIFLGFAPFKNGYFEYPYLTTTLYHIKTHSWILVKVIHDAGRHYVFECVFICYVTI